MKNCHLFKKRNIKEVNRGLKKKWLVMRMSERKKKKGNVKIKRWMKYNNEDYYFLSFCSESFLLVEEKKRKKKAKTGHNHERITSPSLMQPLAPGGKKHRPTELGSSWSRLEPIEFLDS